MIRVRELRFLTAVLIIGLAGYTVRRAAPMLEFGVAELFAGAPNVEASLRPYADSPLVGYMARRDLLAMAIPANPKRQAAEIAGLLRHTPLSSETWLKLALARRALGAQASEIASALALSQLTGPNEGLLMARRAVFGIPLWSSFPPDLRRVLVGDLIGGWKQIQAPQRAALLAILEAGRPETRQEIYADLLLAGAPAALVIDALDLAPPEPATP
jgi:hypothetical protein